MKSWARIRREISERWLGLRLAASGRMHQYPEVLALRRLIARFGITHVIDVGANAGQYATMLRKDVGFGGFILSFEPNPAPYAALAARARADSRWTAHNLALSQADGTATFNVMAADQFSSLNAPRAEQDAMFAGHNRVAHTVEVKTRRLEGMLDALGIDRNSRVLLKLDTQGHDRTVCQGAGKALAAMVAVQTELSLRPLYEGGTDWQAMIAYLRDTGFIPGAMFANNEGHFPLLVEMDGLFVRSDLVNDNGAA